MITRTSVDERSVTVKAAVRTGRRTIGIRVAVALVGLLVLGVAGFALVESGGLDDAGFLGIAQYDLSSVDGHTLPVDFIVGGELILRYGSQWTIELNEGYEAGYQSVMLDGTYTRSGNEFVFRPDASDAVPQFVGQGSGGSSLTTRFDFDGDGTPETFLFLR
jgi:hypothetical protein